MQLRPIAINAPNGEPILSPTAIAQIGGNRSRDVAKTAAEQREQREQREHASEGSE